MTGWDCHTVFAMAKVLSDLRYLISFLFYTIPLASVVEFDTFIGFIIDEHSFYGVGDGYRTCVGHTGNDKAFFFGFQDDEPIRYIFRPAICLVFQCTDPNFGRVPAGNYICWFFYTGGAVGQNTDVLCDRIPTTSFRTPYGISNGRCACIYRRYQAILVYSCNSRVAAFPKVKILSPGTFTIFSVFITFNISRGIVFCIKLERAVRNSISTNIIYITYNLNWRNDRCRIEYRVILCRRETAKYFIYITILGIHQAIVSLVFFMEILYNISVRSFSHNIRKVDAVITALPLVFHNTKFSTPSFRRPGIIIFRIFRVGSIYNGHGYCFTSADFFFGCIYYHIKLYSRCHTGIKRKII